MNLSELQGEDKLLLARLEDLAKGGERAPRFSSFLNEGQGRIAEAFISRRGLDHGVLYGGYPDAVRRVAGFFPPYTQPDAADFPIFAVDVSYKKEYELSHRDFLGSLTGLRIKRESVGDILIEPGLCTIFLLEPVAGTVLGELDKVGRVGVRCEPAGQREFVRKQEFREIRGTVSSLRLDCVVSLATNLSREKSAALIRGEKVQWEYRTASEISRQVAPGECITIRGYGKYLVEEIGPTNRKGRLPLLLRKYL